MTNKVDRTRGRKPVVQCTHAQWKEMVSQMKACCPPPEGYDWRFMWCNKIDDEDSTGENKHRDPKDGKRGIYYIKILKGLSYTETLDTIMHEMAHSYDHETTRKSHSWGGFHSDTFWIWHGRIYRRWHGE